MNFVILWTNYIQKNFFQFKIQMRQRKSFGKSKNKVAMDVKTDFTGHNPALLYPKIRRTV